MELRAHPRRHEGALVELEGKTVRALTASLTEVEGKPRVECADGPLWIVETEELGDEEATPTRAESSG